LREPEQFVGHCDRVDVRVLAVVEVSVRPPDALEHFDVEAETLDGAAEAEPRVAPVLPEVAVHRVLLPRKKPFTWAGEKIDPLFRLTLEIVIFHFISKVLKMI